MFVKEKQSTVPIPLIMSSLDIIFETSAKGIFWFNTRCTYFRQYCNEHSTTQCFHISCPLSFFRLRQINSFDAEMNKISVQIVGRSSEDKHYFSAKMYLNLRTWKYIFIKFGVCIRLFGSRCRVCILDFSALDYWKWHSAHCTALTLVRCYECSYSWIIINTNICV